MLVVTNTLLEDRLKPIKNGPKSGIFIWSVILGPSGGSDLTDL